MVPINCIFSFDYNQYTSYFCYFRVDLTSEKRYSLAPATKNVLKILMIMYIFKFLDGKLSPSYKRLQKLS